ncbi:M1 family aminopeptidase [Agaribacter marinus]|uniref:Peptidase M1 membrane alanine aminopeptidase domain-containing protein n=1 Tax=Agaribacter marinus TaxID=1431249 RepID=A0AA37WIS2_9ALTE|nr:M1 family aminopeptidase [Agaribacter marinus]GLR69724.1 hypothetical protein GCM10007852_06320 [Agaribacter marinus]
MLLLNEFRFLFRQPLVWLSLVILPLFSTLLAIGSGGENTDSGKQLIYLHSALIMLAVPILVGAISALLLIRDNTYNMHALVAATPISYTKRLLVRYSALSIFSISMTFVAMMLISIILWQRTGSFLLSTTLIHAAVFLLPSVLLMSAIAIWLSSKQYGVYSLYAVFAAIWLGYVALASLSGSPILAGSTIANNALLSMMIWLDPFGLTAYLQALLSGEHAAIDMQVLLNRLIILTLTSAIIYNALHQKTPPKPHSNLKIKQPQPINPKHSSTMYHQIGTQAAPIQILAELSRTALNNLISNKLNLLILCGWIVLVFSEASAGLDYAEPFSVVQPTSHDALNRVLWDVVANLGALLVLFWTWQLAWLNKRSQIHELIAASPVSSTVLVGSQIIATTAMLCILALATAVGTSLAEWLLQSEWNLTLYLQYLGLAFLPLLLLAGVFIAINTCCRHQLLAIGLSLFVLVVKFTSFTSLLGIAHPLWNIAGTPMVMGDMQWGFSASGESYIPFIGVWLLVIGSVMVLSVLRSHRGTAMIANREAFLSSRNIWLICFGLATLAVTHQLLKLQHPFIGFSTSDQWRAAYEKQYSHWHEIPQPTVIHINANVDFYPDDSMAELNLDMLLTNNTKERIERVLVGGFAAQDYQHIALDDASLTEFDEVLNQYQFTLATPMTEGETRHLTVKFIYRQPSLFAASMHQIVRPEFSYIRGIPIVPSVGFNPKYRIRNNDIREAHGVDRIPSLPPSEIFKHPQDDVGQYDWVTIHSVVSTTESQFAIAQGDLVRQWTTDDRAYFEYKSSGPIRNIPAWLSTPNAPTSTSVEGRQLSVFSPASAQIDAFHLQAMQSTVDWFTTNGMTHEFGHLNLISMPDIGPTGYALPGIVLINHKVGFRAYPNVHAGFDQRFRRTVHETAHQWFGHGIGNGVDHDRAFLIESLAKYIELVLIEQAYGKEAVTALVDYERERFRLQRANNQLLPLSLIDARASFEMYSAASVVFDTLRNEIGDQPIINALNVIWNHHKYPQRPATSMDFIRALKHQLGKDWDDRIDELFLSPLTIDSIVINKSSTARYPDSFTV